jgi:hypothetical protein
VVLLAPGFGCAEKVISGFWDHRQGKLRYHVPLSTLVIEACCAVLSAQEM